MPKKLGSQSPFKITDKQPKEGVAFGLEAGYRLDNKLRFGLNLNFANVKLHKFSITDNKTNVDTAVNGAKIKTLGADFNTYFDIMNYKGVTLCNCWDWDCEKQNFFFGKGRYWKCFKGHY